MTSTSLIGVDIMPNGLSIMNCKTGVDFENFIIRLLRESGIDASSTGKEDKGVDIVALANLDGITNKFYIQCKYWNNTIGLHPIQEVYTGTHYFGNDGTPVLITNNRVSLEARIYAKKLGVEVIGDAELKELRDSYKAKSIKNPNAQGLLGIMLGACVGDLEYAKRSMMKPKEKIDTKEELKLTLISDFDKATEYTKEAARLQQEASYLTQKALTLQKEALLRNLDYG